MKPQIFVVTGLFALMCANVPAVAQQTPTAEQIIERLKGGAGVPAGADPGAARRTRGLSVSPGTVAAPPPGSGTTPAAATAPPAGIPPPAPDKGVVDQVFAKSPRGLSSGERQQVANIVKAKPAIDLEIYFDFNSAEIGPKAVPALLELGRALSSDALAGTRFLVGGHTDSKGAGPYNQKLSEQRAEAIRRFLVTQFKVDEARLLAIGFGKEQLKNKADPFAGENRRVQVVNLDGR